MFSSVRLLSGLSILFFSLASSASMIELRGHYSQWSTAPKDFNDAFNRATPGYPELGGASAMGADFLYLPNQFLLGVRYESLSIAKDGDYTVLSVTVTSKTKFSGSRLSGVLGYRFTDEKERPFFGLIGTVGVLQTGNYESTTTVLGTSTKLEYEGTVDTSFSAGVEGGYKFGKFLLGGEAGYISYKVKSFKNKTTSQPLKEANGADYTMTLSGGYLRVMLGAAF
jgi:hypothetical protein